MPLLEFSPVSFIIISIMLPLSIILIATGLSVKYYLKRKSIGTVLTVIGFLEVILFNMFSITFEGIKYRLPYTLRANMLLLGSITVIWGIITLFYAKPKKQ